MMKIAPLVSSLARGEGLVGHARAAEIRIKRGALREEKTSEDERTGAFTGKYIHFVLMEWMYR